MPVRDLDPRIHPLGGAQGPVVYRCGARRRGLRGDPPSRCVPRASHPRAPASSGAPRAHLHTSAIRASRHLFLPLWAADRARHYGWWARFGRKKAPSGAVASPIAVGGMNSTTTGRKWVEWTCGTMHEGTILGFVLRVLVAPTGTATHYKARPAVCMSRRALFLTFLPTNQHESSTV